MESVQKWHFDVRWTAQQKACIHKFLRHVLTPDGTCISEYMQNLFLIFYLNLFV